MNSEESSHETNDVAENFGGDVLIEVGNATNSEHEIESSNGVAVNDFPIVSEDAAKYDAHSLENDYADESIDVYLSSYYGAVDGNSEFNGYSNDYTSSCQGEVDIFTQDPIEMYLNHGGFTHLGTDDIYQVQCALSGHLDPSRLNDAANDKYDSVAISTEMEDCGDFIEAYSSHIIGPSNENRHSPSVSGKLEPRRTDSQRVHTQTQSNQAATSKVSSYGTIDSALQRDEIIQNNTSSAIDRVESQAPMYDAHMKKQGGTESPIVSSSQAPLQINTAIMVFLAAILVVVSLLMNIREGGESDVTVDMYDDDYVADTVDISFTLTRQGYDALPYFSAAYLDKVLNYEFLKKYTGVWEPSVPMQLSILNDSSVNDTLAYYKYSVYNTADLERELAAGSYYPHDPTSSIATTVSCNPFDELYVSVIQHSDIYGKGSFGGVVVCMYVRREVRDLTTADLNATMDAMHALWQYSDDDGQALFGENFHSSDYFTEIHNFNAAWQDSDHIHEGLGFIPQHLKMTNMFESAMQAVDPSVSLFYWDYTIEESQGSKIFQSYVFTPAIFGTLYEPASPSTGWTYSDDRYDDARIMDGRWQDLEAEQSVRYPELANGYGYMRGPWNMNPSIYVTRFAANFPDLPGCLDYSSWLQSSDFSTFMKTAPYGPHSTTHSAIGGVYGCDTLDDMLAQGLITDSKAQVDICQKWGFWIKELYRGYYITPQADCDISRVSCRFECDTSKLGDMLDVLRYTVTLNQFVPDDLTDHQWEEWRDFVCTGDAYKIFVGDHLESASPSDPSFWPIHPTQERLVQARYMAGWFADDTWPTDPEGTAYICNHSECYEYADEDKDYYPFCCYGHYEFDQLMDFVSGNRSQGVGPTNSEVMVGTDASSGDYSMPYIYSHFEWSHCDESFEDLAEELLTENSGRR